MNQLVKDATIGASLCDITNTYPYTPSIASAASSSASSIFSNDARSSQTSAPSSVKSGSSGWDLDNGNGQADYLSTIGPQPLRVPQQNAIHVQITKQENVIPEGLRQNPKRTQPSAPVENGQIQSRVPPALVRQCDRKDNFVESLVGKFQPSSFKKKKAV
jgi:PHO85 cyclin-5